MLYPKLKHKFWPLLRLETLYHESVTVRRPFCAADSHTIFYICLYNDQCKTRVVMGERSLWSEYRRTIDVIEWYDQRTWSESGVQPVWLVNKVLQTVFASSVQT